MPSRVSSAAAGRPVRSAIQRTPTITATPPRISTSIVSGLTAAVSRTAATTPCRGGSGVDHDRDDDRAAPVGAVRPLADGARDELLQLDRTAHTLLGRPGERLLDERFHLGEGGLVVHEAPGEEVGRL